LTLKKLTLLLLVLAAVLATAASARSLHYEVRVVKTGTGSGRVTGEGQGANSTSIDCGNTCSALINGMNDLVLQADPDPGSTFTGWGGCMSTSGNTCTVHFEDESRGNTVTAGFDCSSECRLNVSKSGSGSGRVTGNGIDCGATCSAGYPAGTSVTLTATPAAGSRFTGWSGACSGTGTCTVTMDRSYDVTASFEGPPPNPTLSVARSGNGAGTVSGGGIDCGSTCQNSYTPGTSVTLTATAAAGSVFTGWSGACGGGAPTCTLTMDVDKGVTATFELPKNAPLTVTKGGNGSGTVVGGGIDCGATCSRTYDLGTPVSLVATAAPDSTFSGWSGACSGTGPCALTLQGPATVTATFTLKPKHTVTVTKEGSGSGYIGGNVAIDCGPTCSAEVVEGTKVTLIASPDLGSRFAGWAGACSGSVPCTLTVDSAKRIVATFAKLDRRAPRVVAKPAAARRGKLAMLRFTLVDDSGRARPTATVGGRGIRAATIRGPMLRALGGTFQLPWRVPRTAPKGTARFCVTAVDAAGNRSARSCANLRILA
jgi:hypothetical protein